MLRQTLPQYKTVKMGFGTGSIYDFGCYLVSLCDGLNRRGHNFTVEQLNDIFKTKKLWIGEFKNYIDVDNLANKWPEVFASFKKIEPYNDQIPQLDDLHIVLGKVDARGIGGSGTHFVEVVGRNGVFDLIGDPWFGDEIRAFDRYGKYGTITGLRVFKIKQKELMTDYYKGLDLENKESMKEAVNIFDEVINKKAFVRLTELQNPIFNPLEVKTVGEAGTQIQNRLEQISRLKEQVTEEQSLRTELSIALKADKEIVKVYENRIVELNQKVTEMAKKEGQHNLDLEGVKQELVLCQTASTTPPEAPSKLAWHEHLVLAIKGLIGLVYKPTV